MKWHAVFLTLILFTHSIGFSQPSPQQLKRETAWHTAKFLLGVWLLAPSLFCIVNHTNEQNLQTTFDHVIYLSFCTLPTCVASLSLVINGAKGIDKVRIQQLLQNCPQKKETEEPLFYGT